MYGDDGGGPQHQDSEAPHAATPERQAEPLVEEVTAVGQDERPFRSRDITIVGSHSYSFDATPFEATQRDLAHESSLLESSDGEHYPVLSNREAFPPMSAPAPAVPIPAPAAPIPAPAAPIPAPAAPIPAPAAPRPNVPIPNALPQNAPGSSVAIAPSAALTPAMAPPPVPPAPSPWTQTPPPAAHPTPLRPPPPTTNREWARHAPMPPPLAPLSDRRGAPIAPPDLNATVPSLSAAPADIKAAPAELDPPAAAVASPAATNPRSGAATRKEMLQMLWFDPDAVPRIRQAKQWQPLFDRLNDEPEHDEFDEVALGDEDARKVEGERDTLEVLVNAAPCSPDRVESEFAKGRRHDGRYLPVLTVFGGTLVLQFDDVEELKASITVASPYASSDKALGVAVADAAAYLDTPHLLTSPDLTRTYTRRISNALVRLKPMISLEYLESQKRRALLERRHYQRSDVFGEQHVRALLVRTGRSSESSQRDELAKGDDGQAKPALRGPAKESSGREGSDASGAEASGTELGAVATSGTSVPVYLPNAMAQKLPLFERLPVKLIAELHPAASQFETHAIALKALALARTWR